MKPRLLIVEDDPILGPLISDYFEREDWDTVIAADGELAQERFEEETFQLILLDIMLPKQDGFTVCRKIRETSDLPIFFITARVLEEDELHGYALGADDYITKPFSLPVLYAKAVTMMKCLRGNASLQKMKKGAIEWRCSHHEKNYRKRIMHQKSIIIGFLVIYIMCMLCSTCLVKENYETAYKDELTNKILSLRTSIYDSYFPKFDEEGKLSDNYIGEITRALSAGLNNGNKYNQICAAVYGPDGTIVARTTDFFGETELLIDYIEKEYKEQQKEDGTRDSYDIHLTYNQYTGEPLQFEITKYKMKQEQKVNELLQDGSKTKSISSSITGSFSFPYISEGKKYYDAWKKNELLQTFNLEDKIYNGKEYTAFTKEYDSNNRSYVYPMQLLNESVLSSHDNTFYLTNDTRNYALQINQASYPWIAAVDYMKYAYLFGFILVIVCMINVIIYANDKTYKKQEELEQIRRDFTNAAAHELKTPLAIVRSIFENMERETSAAKNEYYLQEGIRQTEVMDNLIQEMIFISKIDSEKIKLKNESIAVTSLIEDHLEKAFFNILENAVSYNRMDGKISIHIEKNCCAINNPGIA